MFSDNLYQGAMLMFLDPFPPHESTEAVCIPEHPERHQANQREQTNCDKQDFGFA
jgi:hypothetical protein